MTTVHPRKEMTPSIRLTLCGGQPGESEFENQRELENLCLGALYPFRQGGQAISYQGIRQGDRLKYCARKGCSHWASSNGRPAQARTIRPGWLRRWDKGRPTQGTNMSGGKPPGRYISNWLRSGFVFKLRTSVSHKFWGLFRQETREPLRHQDDSHSGLGAKVRLAWFHCCISRAEW